MCESLANINSNNEDFMKRFFSVKSGLIINKCVYLRYKALSVKLFVKYFSKSFANESIFLNWEEKTQN